MTARRTWAPSRASVRFPEWVGQTASRLPRRTSRWPVRSLLAQGVLAGVGLAFLAARVRARRVRVRRVDVAGYTAHCHVSGEGPDLVLLASPLVRARTYWPLLWKLARHFRVTVVELPGSGRASPVERPWTVPEYAAWTAELVPRLSPARPWLMGHSDSGAIALLVGAWCPERVRGLVLADSVGARRKRSVPRVVAARLLDGLLEPVLDVRAGWHLLSNVLKHPRSFFHRVRESSVVDVLGFASWVAVPTLVAWGRHDHTMPPECARRLAGRLRRARLYIGPGSHDSPITRPRAFTRAVMDFTHAGAESREEARVCGSTHAEAQGAG
jgi:pimeloyl-ACP methyl ester carboxylesterase